MNKNTSNEIVLILEDIIKNPVCELDFNNNFELLCAVMLSAQTTDKRVNLVTKNLFEKYKTPYELSIADYNDVYNIIESVGLAKNKTKNLIEIAKAIHNDYNDIIPNTIDELIKLPGVGRKTANVVLAVGFKIPTMPVDTHIHRMAKRLGYIKSSDDVAKAEASLKKYISKDKWIDIHHRLLLFGRYHCKSISPSCDNCKLIKYCKYKNV